MSRPGNSHRRNLTLLWASQFVNTAGLMMLVPIMPFYVQDLGVRGVAAVQTWAGVAIAAPALALTVATPLWGRLGDRMGRHWMVVRALVGLAAAMLVMATAANPIVLVLGRLLQGGLGGVVEAAQAFAGASSPQGKRGSALGKSFSATAAGSLTGPLLGGLLVGPGQLSALMLAIAALAALLAVACGLGLRDERATGASPAVDQHAQRGETTAAAKFRTLPAAIPLAVAAVAAYLGVYGLIPVFATHVQQNYPAGQAEMWAGVFQSLTWGATLIAAFWWGRHNDGAQRPVRALAWACAGCAIGIAAQALPLGTGALIALRLLQGVSFAALAQSLFFHVTRWAPVERRSGHVGKANSFLLIGQSAGPLLAGPMALAFPAPTSIALFGAACAVATLCCLQAARTEAANTPRSGETGVLGSVSGDWDLPAERTQPIPPVPAGTTVRAGTSVHAR